MTIQPGNHESAAICRVRAHYGVLIDPARRAGRVTRPRVRRPMPYCRDSFFRGWEFTSIKQMQAAVAQRHSPCPKGHQRSRRHAPSQRSEGRRLPPEQSEVLPPWSLTSGARGEIGSRSWRRFHH